MSALARMEASTAASGILPGRDYGPEAHTPRLVSKPCCHSRHDTPTQRSLSLFRISHSRSSETPATSMSCDSQDTDAQQAPAAAQPVITVADHGNVLFAQPSTPSSARRRLWSAGSVALLRGGYPTVKLVRDISAELGRSVGAVYSKARRLGLMRPRRGLVPVGSTVALSIPASILEALQPGVDPAPAPSPLTPLAIQPALPALQPSPAPKTERTKMGGRPGCWAKNDGALSERLERLFIVNFSPACIAAVLGMTESSVATRAWVVNCPRRDPKMLRHDVEAARLVDRLAAPLPASVWSWKQDKVLVRKRCRRKGHYIWGTNSTTLSNDAKRQRSYRMLAASAPLHAW